MYEIDGVTPFLVVKGTGRSYGFLMLYYQYQLANESRVYIDENRFMSK
jgi:hypothetical protein